MILDRLIRWKRDRPNSVLGIDIGISTVKLAEVMRYKDRFVVGNIGMAKMPEHVIVDGSIIDRDALLQVLSNLLSVSGISCQETVIAIAGRNILVREVLFPLMTEKELREAVKWDMEKYIPYASEAYYFDFAILSHLADTQEMKVLLVVAPKDNVDLLLNVIKKAGLKPIAVEVEALALYRTLKCAENSMVINIGKYASQVILFQNSSPVVTRSISIGGQRFTEVIMGVLDLDSAEAELLKLQPKALQQQVELSGKKSEIDNNVELLISKFSREIHRTLEYYQIQNTKAAVDKIFLLGGGARLEYLVQGLSKHLDKAVQLHNPLSDLGIANSFDKQYINDVSPQLAVAIGLAMRGCEP